MNAAQAPSAASRIGIALFQPDIAGNVGTVLRLAACMQVPVDLIEPMGFPFGDRALRRAAMDYGTHVTLTRHTDWQAFLAARATARLVLATTKAATRIDQFRFQPGDILLLGSEGAGVPDMVHDRADARVRVPMAAGMRSLNVAVSAAMLLGEALRQTGGWPE